MDDGNKQPHSFGSGQQQHGHHPRPFFYVQPPSQPYYLYQHWHLNNPYNLYGLPGGYTLGRPIMHHYPYVHPGFVLPHPQIHPMDYRRMFEPRFHGPPWNDLLHHQHHSQPQGRREMACSEAQTDPSDAITKLIECLDKIRASELGAERELDSGVASQSSGIFSPADEKKSEEQGVACASSSTSSSSVPDGGHLKSPPVTFSDSTTAVYDGESSQRSIEDMSPPGCWPVEFDEELPLDSSSVHEECPAAKQAAAEDEPFLPPERTCLPETASIQSLPARFPSTQPTHKDPTKSDNISEMENQAESPDEVSVGPSYQILKLPFESSLTARTQSAALSSPTAPYYLSYLTTQTTHERMSVLSPSLDELSSRDEMFSTDLEDVDLFPKRVYTSRRLAEVVGGSPQAAGGVGRVRSAGSKRFSCACCGKSVAKGASRGEVRGSKLYEDEAGDSDEETRCGRSCEHPARVVVRKHFVPRKAHPLPVRPGSKPWCKRGQCKDPTSTVDQEEALDLCKEDQTGREAVEIASDQQCRTCQGKSEGFLFNLILCSRCT
uniref:Bucky ball n=1 Tax=Myripristis murdjan TaxID=586833 RepID=A0A667YSS1_9TELE